MVGGVHTSASQNSPLLQSSPTRTTTMHTSIQYGSLEPDEAKANEAQSDIEFSVHSMQSETQIETLSNTSHSEDAIIIGGVKLPPLRRIALALSLYINLFITLTKLVAYIQTLSLSVLAALLDSVLDVVSQLVLNYTEKHSSMQRSSAVYPAGARYGGLTPPVSCFSQNTFAHLVLAAAWSPSVYSHVRHSWVWLRLRS